MFKMLKAGFGVLKDKDYSGVEAILMVLVMLFVLFGIFSFVGWITMLLWNAVAVPAVGVSEIGFWSSMGLLILCDILFKSSTSNKGNK